MSVGHGLLLFLLVSRSPCVMDGADRRISEYGRNDLLSLSHIPYVRSMAHICQEFKSHEYRSGVNGRAVTPTDVSRILVACYQAWLYLVAGVPLPGTSPSAGTRAHSSTMTLTYKTMLAILSPTPLSSVSVEEGFPSKISLARL